MNNYFRSSISRNGDVNRIRRLDFFRVNGRAFRNLEPLPELPTGSV